MNFLMNYLNIWEGLGLTEEQVNQIINTLREEELGNVGNLQTEAKDLVGAINELFQNANNGKELIASAIGEPVSAEDTFQAMSTDINGLLATFKANMMNNGITVESGDKFKSLIDKIATMVEEGSGKGIKFAEGSDSTFMSSGAGSSEAGSSRDNKIIMNLDFTPTIIFVNALIVNGMYLASNSGNVGGTNIIVNSLQETTLSGKGCSLSINSITAESFNLKLSHSYAYTQASLSVNGIKWYAIGVGEEDTTLLDSLKSILENKGVDVTEEDDMASLITKVDDLQVSAYLPTEGYDYNLAFVNKQTVTGNTYTTVLEKTIPKGISTVRLELFLQSGTSTSVKAYCYVTHSRNGSELYSNEYSSSSYGSYQEKGNTFEVLEGDVIKVQLKGGSSTGTAIIANVSLSVGVAIK